MAILERQVDGAANSHTSGNLTTSTGADGAWTVYSSFISTVNGVPTTTLRPVSTESSTGSNGAVAATTSSPAISTASSLASSTAIPPATTATSSTSTAGVLSGNVGGTTSNSQASSNPVAVDGQANSTNTTSTNTNHKCKYTTGALAGAIVGSIIGAALLTFLVAFLFFRKRNQRQPSQEVGSGRSRRPSSKGLINGDEKAGLAGAGVAGGAAGAGLGWAAYLPQSADDKTLQHSVKTLYEQIELHVDNYYHKAGGNLDEHARGALSKIDTGRLPAPISDLMSNQSTQLSVIKHCIANVLITRITPGRDATSSLLPANLAVYPSKLGQSSSSSRETAAADQAYSQYRLLTTYLFPTNPSQSSSSSSHQNNTVAASISDLIYDAFSPWGASKADSAALQQHERTLIDNAADTGLLVASQPSKYDFRWDAGKSGGNRSLVILPGFWKTGDEQGRTLGQSQLVVSPSITRV